MSTSTAHVVIHLPALGRGVGATQLSVQIEDTSEADARATVVSRLTLETRALDLTVPLTLAFDMPYDGAAAGLSVSGTLKARGGAALNLITTAVVPIQPGQTSHVHLVEHRIR